MKSNIIKKKEANILLLKKDSCNTSINELNQLSLNFRINTFHKKNNSKKAQLYNNYNYISKINNYKKQLKGNSIINTYIKNSSPNTNIKRTNIDISNSNIDLTSKISLKDNLTSRELQKDLQYIHHKKINSHYLLKNNQIKNEFSPNNTKKDKDLTFKNETKNNSKIFKKKNIQIDTRNINNNQNPNLNININNNTKKITTNNNQHKINLKIYLEKHKRVLSTDYNNINNNKNIKIISKNKKYQNYKKKGQNSVLKNKRIITSQNSTRLINHLNYTRNITLSRANSSWIHKGYNIFNTSLEKSFSKIKNNKNKDNNKVKINSVMAKNIKNFNEQKKLKLINKDLKNNDLLKFNKLKEKTTLYYLTNISEELKSKKKNYNNGNNIFININNYNNDNKKRGTKSKLNLTEGKDIIYIKNYLSKKSKSQIGKSKFRRRNNLKNNEMNSKILYGSKYLIKNKTFDNFNLNNSDNDKIEGPEQSHFFFVSNIQKGNKYITNYK